MLITQTPGGTGKREEVAQQIQEVAPTDSRGGPTTYVVWHFAPCGTLLWGLIQEVAPQIQEVASTDSRGGPHHTCGVALCSVWHLVPFRIRRTLARLQIHPHNPDTRHALPDASMIVLLTRVTVQGTWVQGIQEFKSTGVQEYKSTRCLVII